MSSCQCSCSCHDKEIDYYWRSYEGKVPPDALAVQQHCGSVFIGQIYLHGHGLFVGKIVPGEKEVEFQGYGVRSITARDGIVKILCTQHKDKFRWVSTNGAGFVRDTANKHVVTAGFNGIENELYQIGKKVHDGVTKIGVLTKGGHEFFYVHNNQSYRTKESYEVLIYE